MSRVYDALQQCVSEQAVHAALPRDNADALFSEQFADSVWDPESVAAVQPILPDAKSIPTSSAPNSFASEQFRLLATRLQHLQQAQPVKSVLLTSSVEGEGKSTLTLNLAISLSRESQNKILIVDAELRKSGLSQLLNVNDRPGLRDWYRSTRTIAEFVYKLKDLNLWLLPSGQALVDPLELLKSPRFSNINNFLGTAFDWVLIDSPPLLPLADAEIISRTSDATIVVVRCDKSPKSALKEALQRVTPSKMVGFLLNEFPSTTMYGNTKEIAEQHLKPMTLQQSDQHP